MACSYSYIRQLLDLIDSEKEGLAKKPITIEQLEKNCFKLLDAAFNNGASHKNIEEVSLACQYYVIEARKLGYVEYNEHKKLLGEIVKYTNKFWGDSNVNIMRQGMAKLETMFKNYRKGEEPNNVFEVLSYKEAKEVVKMASDVIMYFNREDVRNQIEYTTGEKIYYMNFPAPDERSTRPAYRDLYELALAMGWTDRELEDEYIIRCRYSFGGKTEDTEGIPEKFCIDAELSERAKEKTYSEKGTTLFLGDD